MASARESRRRRIVERGSDRLAFISGQTSSLPPPPSFSSSSSRQDFPQAPSLPKTDVPTTYDKDDSAVLPKFETSNEAARNFLDTYSNVEPSISSSLEASSNPVVSSSIQASTNPVVSTEPRLIPQPNNRRSVFTADRIISSISASENIRLICSATIAFLAVLSYSMYPLSHSIIKSMVRPVYLVLVTDVTIVLGLLMANKGGSDKAEAEARRAAVNTDDWADSLAKALEVGLVLQKAMNAVLMDCSVCAVLLISVLSLLRLG